jgi:hypothetical protein
MKFGSCTNGLGDLLLLTAVCKYFPGQFTIQIPTGKERFKILFAGLAKVEICNSAEIQPLPDLGSGHYATRKLRNFFGDTADGLDNRPLVFYSNKEHLKWAQDFIEKTGPSVVLVPTCSKEWANVRNLPKKIFDSALEIIKSNGFKPLICQSSANRATTSELELIDLDLSKYIALLRTTGIYWGCNTGDEHLAAAVGCETHVFQPKDGNGFISREWNYEHPNSNYYTWNDNHTC